MVKIKKNKLQIVLKQLCHLVEGGSEYLTIPTHLL